MKKKGAYLRSGSFELAEFTRDAVGERIILSDKGSNIKLDVLSVLDIVRALATAMVGAPETGV